MSFLTASDAERRRRKAELSEFKADLEIIRERFQRVKVEDMQLSFQLHHLRDQEDKENPVGVISGKGIRAYEPPAITKMYSSAANARSLGKHGGSRFGGKSNPDAAVSPFALTTNVLHGQPETETAVADDGAASSPFSYLQHLISGTFPWSRPASSHSADGVDASQPSSAATKGAASDGSHALGPELAGLDSMPRLSRVRRSAHRVGVVAVSTPSPSSFLMTSSTDNSQGSTPANVLRLSENSPSCVGIGISASAAGPATDAPLSAAGASRSARASASGGTTRETIAKLRAQLNEDRGKPGGLRTRLFTDAAKEALLIRAGLLPAPSATAASASTSNSADAAEDAISVRSLPIGARGDLTDCDSSPPQVAELLACSPSLSERLAARTAVRSAVGAAAAAACAPKAARRLDVSKLLRESEDEGYGSPTAIAVQVEAS